MTDIGASIRSTNEVDDDQEDTPLLAEQEQYPTTSRSPRRRRRLDKNLELILGGGVFILLAVILITVVTVSLFISLRPSGSDQSSLAWWKTTVIYQCYPLSFQDTSGNSKGDLNGIKERAQYFTDIGIDTVLLNPIYKSPLEDNGYDIIDYKDIDLLFGTLEGLRALLDELHAKGIRLLMDFVPNATSDKHPWFVDSSSSKTNSKRDWYVWADGNKYGGPPSNWISKVGGSAWTFDNTTGQYFYHSFGAFQPDLNYHSPEVRDAMTDVLKFWLDFGVDGFRIDALMFLLENPQFKNDSLNPNYNGPDCTTNVSNPVCYDSLNHTETLDYTGMHELVQEWRNLIDSYNDRFVVGETYGPVKTVVKYYGDKGSELNFPLNFQFLDNTNWTGIEVSRIVSSWLDNMPEGTWPNWVLGNHDNSRIPNKAGLYLARALNTLLLTLPGTPTTYYGEELLMTDGYIPPNRTHDEKYLDRDKERTPMQWNGGPNAGFTATGIEPWLPLPDNYTTYNVESEKRNQTSMLVLYKQLVQVRSTNAAFQYAEYSLVLNTTDVYAYHRYHESSDTEFIVVINFSQDATIANLSKAPKTVQNPEVELSSDTNRENTVVDLTNVYLDSGEALIIRGKRS